MQGGGRGGGRLGLQACDDLTCFPDPPGARRRLGQEHHAVVPVRQVEGRVGRIEHAAQRLVGFRVLARADQAEPADQLHATQQAVQAAATRCALNLAGHGLRLLVVAAQRDDHGVQRERAGVEERLPGLVGQPLCLLGAGRRPVPVPELEVVEHLHAQHLGQQPEPALLAQFRLGAAEEVRGPHQIAYGVCGLAEQPERSRDRRRSPAPLPSRISVTSWPCRTGSATARTEA